MRNSSMWLFSCLVWLLVIIWKTEVVESYACGSNQYQCLSGECLPTRWKCDDEVDCKDGSDEGEAAGCVQSACTDAEFTCDDGKCIPKRWQCDGEADCGDESDEKDALCSVRQCNATTEFRCANSTMCIPIGWQCDHGKDCPHGDDEVGCATTCESNELQCDTDKCITIRWKCDQDKDCDDGTDEEGCAQPTCAADQFTCADGKCIPRRWTCDGDPDCLDNSDEHNCTTTTSPSPCSTTEFKCTNSNLCIHKSWKCDGDKDCMDGSDEAGCVKPTCDESQFQCAVSGHCLPLHMKCDGLKQCPGDDESDETQCVIIKQCDPLTEMTCNNSSDDRVCVPFSHVCDNRRDCNDGEDENIHMCNSRVNECLTNNGGCHQICVDTPTSFLCQCNPGFELDPIYQKHCRDIDECKIFGTCSHICNNTVGGHKCSCFNGYTLDPYDRRTCRANNGETPSILFANRQDIRMITKTDEYFPVVQGLRSAIAMDYNYKNKVVFWSDVAKEEILSAKMNLDPSGSKSVDNEKTVIVSEDLSTPDGLAHDWVHNTLYWTDTGKDRIEVISLGATKYRKKLVTEDLDEPRAIVLDPANGYMYWTDWGARPRIEKCGMDGTRRVQKDNKQNGLVTHNVLWPNGLTIDYTVKRLFWVDAKLHSIGSCKLDGTDVRNILTSSQASGHLKHPFSITVFEHLVYWTDWETESIMSTDMYGYKYDGDNNIAVNVEKNDLYSPMDIHIYHEYRQQQFYNRCKDNACSDFCLPSPIETRLYTCHCEEGYTLLSDGYTCNKSGSKTTPFPSTTERSSSISNSSINRSTKEFTPSTVPSARPTTPKSQTLTTNTTNLSTGATPRTTTQATKTTVPPSELPHVTAASTTNDNVGQIAGIVIGIVGALILIGGLVGYVVYRQFIRKNVKSMNFDNPVYRKTTEEQFTIDSQYQPSKEVPPTLQPLTSGDGNEYV